MPDSRFPSRRRSALSRLGLGLLGFGVLVLGPLAGRASALPVSCIPGGSSVTTCIFAEDLGKGDISGERLGPGEHPSSDLAQQQFLQKLVGSVRTENFETFGDDTQSPIALPFPGAGSQVFAAILDSAPTSGFGRVNEVTDPLGTNGVGRFPIDGIKYYETGQFLFHILFCSDPATLLSCQQSLRPVAAFGFYATDIGEADPAIQGRLSVELRHTDGSSVVIPVPHESMIGGSVSYLGVIDAVGFNEVIFQTRLNDNPTGGLDAFGFDLFTVALAEQLTPAVPVPPSLLLLLASGVVALPAIRRRALR